MTAPLKGNMDILVSFPSLLFWLSSLKLINESNLAKDNGMQKSALSLIL